MTISQDARHELMMMANEAFLHPHASIQDLAHELSDWVKRSTVDGWQDISTAPKNGTVLLICDVERSPIRCEFRSPSSHKDNPPTEVMVIAPEFYESIKP